jgi:subtilisin family serine protease
MERASVIAATAVVIALLAGTAFAAGDPALRRVVVFTDGTSADIQTQVIAASGSRLLRVLPIVNGVSIALPALDSAAALTFLQTHPAVAAVYDDPRFGAHGAVVANGAGGDGAGGDGAGGDHVVFITPVPAPSKEMYPWGIERIGAADVQRDVHDLGGGVQVAVFDTGIDLNHPDLAQNIIGGLNAIADDNSDSYQDDNGHGTAMAGIIAARINRLGVIGGAPHALLYAVKVLDKNGRGHTSDTIWALGELMNRPEIRVINMSFGTSLVWPLFPIAIQRATDAGKIIVASRGNGCSPSSGSAANGAGGDGAGGDAQCTCTAQSSANGAGGDGAGGDAACGSAVKYPAAYPEVITVGATTIRDKVAGYSLSGGVDVVAPGGDSEQQILSTNVGGGYGLITGTSPAAAHVTAAVALAVHLRPRISVDRVAELLQLTADHLDCLGCTIEKQGAGLIDVRAMVDELTRRRIRDWDD